MSKIVAIAALKESDVRGGGVPTFYSDDTASMQNIAFTLEKILDATAHDLKNGTIILVRHEGHSV